MNAHEKIRAALGAAIAYPNSTHAELKAHEALAALAELERAADPRLWLAEPVAGDYATYENDAVAASPDEAIKRAERCHYAEFRAVPLYTAPPPAPVAEMREPTDEECREMWSICTNYDVDVLDKAECGRSMFNAVRAVMGGES